MTVYRERTPIHPGEILAEDVLAELGMNANQLGKALGVPPTASPRSCAGDATSR